MGFALNDSNFGDYERPLGGRVYIVFAVADTHLTQAAIAGAREFSDTSTRYASIYPWVGQGRLDGSKILAKRIPWIKRLKINRILGTAPMGVIPEPDLKMITKVGQRCRSADTILVISDNSAGSKVATQFLSGIVSKVIHVMEVSSIHTRNVDMSSIFSKLSAVAPRGVVVIIGPNWTQSGSASTFDLTSRIVSQNGLIPVFLALSIYRSQRKFHFGRNYAHSPETAWDGLRCTLTPSKTLGFINFVKWSLSANKGLVTWYSQRYNSVIVPRELSRLLTHLPIKKIYVNHVWSLPFTRRAITRLCDGQVPMILDTHDIQTFNFAGQGHVVPLVLRQADARDELAHEVAQIATVDHAIFVSDQERELFELIAQEQRLKKIGTSTAIPMPMAKSPIPEGSRDKDSLWNGIIVMANNNANAQSLEWFVTKVIPQVKNSQLRIVIVGDIKNHAQNWGGIPDCLEFVGRVETMDSWYERSQFSIIPIVTGGGIAIKTLEALKFGMPFVATTHALRGVPTHSALRGIDDPNGFASEIDRLIEDGPYRRELERISRLTVDEMNHASYEKSLPGLLQ